MKINLKKLFRSSFIIGLLLLFLSMWLDWYYVQVINDENKLMAMWSYNPLTEWHSISNNNNSIKKPPDLLIPFIINVIFIVTIIVSAYIVLFNDVERKEDLEKLYPFAYIIFFLVILNLYYIFAFPLFYLIPNDLYFPFMKIKNKDLDVTYCYYIGAGYIFQIISFILIFPYAVYYYKTIEKFRIKEHSPKKVIKKYIKHIQEPLDLDKLITEEELRLKYNDLPMKENQPILNKKVKRRS